MTRSVLPDLDVFAAVARHRSFRAAATERDVSVSLISQTIRRLEEQMGVTLLTRTTRSVTPTAAGRELLAQLEPGLALIRTAVERLDAHRGSPLGSLRINAPAPGHSQMEYQRILTIGVNKAIFGAPPQRIDSRARQPLAQIDRNWPAQVRTAWFCPHDNLAFKHRTQAGDCGFHFR